MQGDTIWPSTLDLEVKPFKSGITHATEMIDNVSNKEKSKTAQNRHNNIILMKEYDNAGKEKILP